MSSPSAEMGTTQKLSKRELYIQIFQQELMRELDYLWDVANHRAPPRSNFTQKLLELLSTVTPAMPVGGEVLAKLASALNFAASQERDRKIALTANIRDQIDPRRLAILAEIVAREAYRRYEYFIENRLSENAESGIIPFAKVGVARCLEYLTRKHQRLVAKASSAAAEIAFELSESIFLAALFEGRSGAFVSDWTNQQVKLDKLVAHNLCLGSAEVDAETVYARSGLMTFSIKNNRLQIQFYTRRTARHHEKDITLRLREIFADGTDSLFNFGYTDFVDSLPNDPKGGFAVVPREIIERYGFDPVEPTLLSQGLQEELTKLANSGLRTVEIDRETLQSYISWYRKQQGAASSASATRAPTIVEYLRTVIGCKEANWVICRENLSGINLSDVNLSDIDFSGAIITGDISNAKFNRSHLVAAQLSGVTAANRVDFSQAKLMFMQAQGVDFSDSIFDHADFSFANIENANLTACKLTGTVWYQTKLTGIRSSEDLLRLQEQKQAVLSRELLAQKSQLKHLQEQLSILNEKISETKDDSEELRQLYANLKKLQFAQQDRFIFEAYCKQQILALQTQLGSEDRETLQQRVQRLNVQLQRNTHDVITLEEEISKKIEELRDETRRQQESVAVLVSARVKKEIKPELAMITEKAQQQETYYTTLLTEMKSHQQALRDVKRDFEQRLQGVEEEVKAIDDKVNLRLQFTDPRRSVIKKIRKLRSQVLQDEFIKQELRYYIEPHGEKDKKPAGPLYPWVKEVFLSDSSKQVLLLQGEAGSGKSTFIRFLLQQLWQDPEWDREQDWTPDAPPRKYLPIYIPLGLSEVKPSQLFHYLKKLPELVIDFESEEIAVLKQDYNLLFLCDGFDEIPPGKGQHNLWDSNKFENYEGRVKLLVSCRNANLVNPAFVKQYFFPHKRVSNEASTENFCRRQVALFNTRQVEEYIGKYWNEQKQLLKDKQEDLLPGGVDAYKRELNRFEDLKKLVTTPFILLMTLKALPRVKDKLSSMPQEEGAQLTRVKLYDMFIKHWFEREANKAKLNGEARSAKALAKDYKQFCFKFAECLHRAKVTMVQYPYNFAEDLYAEPRATARAHYEEGPQGPWVEILLGDKEERRRRARQGAPLLLSTGNNWQFINVSLLDYFYTTAIAKPIKSIVDAAAGTPTLVTVLKNYSPEELLQESLLTSDQLLFLAERVKTESNFKQKLESLIERSEEDRSLDIARRNAENILEISKNTLDSEGSKYKRVSSISSFGDISAASSAAAGAQGQEAVAAVLPGTAQLTQSHGFFQTTAGTSSSTVSLAEASAAAAISPPAAAASEAGTPAAPSKRISSGASS